MKRILLTGDDGYKSIGTRLLIAVLKPHFDLTVVGTKTQMSGVGGYINVTKKISWGETHVDGVPAIWLDGTPADAMEFAREHYRRRFDLVISGINMGVNIGASIISSGTFAAAFRAVALGVAPVSMAVSWSVAFHQLYKNHSGDETIEHYHQYPGLTAARLVRLALKQKFWDAQLLNINFPAAPASRVRFTRLQTDIYGYWPPIVIKKNPRRFWYAPGLPNEKPGTLTDAEVIAAGDIAVTLASFDMTDERAYRKMKGKILTV